MLTLIIGNKAYSSWSLRGWLACKQSGLAFDEVVVPIYDDAWPARRTAPDLALSGGRVPTLWHGDAAVWDSMAILTYLDGLTGGARFWPADPGARALAMSMAAEMHSGFTALRIACPMNVRHQFAPRPVDATIVGELARIAALWSQARARFGTSADYLFGEFGAADIMFAPVCMRIKYYQLPVEDGAQRYVGAVHAHPWLQDWIGAARQEPWVIERFEPPINA